MHKTYDKVAIQSIVDEYRLSEIQSESEVRSKFIVRLSEVLGYPSQLRGEEFPVYGYGGRDALKAKNTDFIFFSDKSFSRYRANTQKNKAWVREHSLLIIEAKKPGKMPEDLGQVQFYAMWTKAVAYIETDGEEFKGYFVNPTSSDLEVIDTKVDELPNKPEVWNLSYENVLSIKQRGYNIKNMDSRLTNMEEDDYQIITEDSDLNIPDRTLSYIRICLGRNAEGLTNVQMVSRFLNTTDSMLQNDMRYDIPLYMIDIPRHIYEAKLYVDSKIFPLITGKVTEFYCNDITRYSFESEYIVAEAIYNKNELSDFEIGYHILDKHVSERLNHFKLVGKCLNADVVTIAVENASGLQITLPSKCSKKMWRSKQHVKTLFEFWLSGMKKLKSIEEYYEIEFKLYTVSDPIELNELYEAIDFVYDGMMLQENCEITLPGDSFEEDFEIKEPIIVEDNKIIPLKDRIIQGFIFRPYRSTWLPSKAKFAGKRANDIVRLPGCCEYRIVEK
ncbi:hypothetical protein D7X87_11075 [bacterium D16-54]|nr:hypothetical protein D7X87_11075 [bacterium D16-54]RKJ14507.1 hypothetical protein D7X65_11670 [bacterium D16-56]